MDSKAMLVSSDMTLASTNELLQQARDLSAGIAERRFHGTVSVPESCLPGNSDKKN